MMNIYFTVVFFLIALSPVVNAGSISGSCKVPLIRNGEFGRYASNGDFERVNKAEVIENKEILTLRCHKGYAPDPRLNNNSKNGLFEEERTCEDGKWPNDLSCKSSSCDYPQRIDRGYPIVGNDREKIRTNEKIDHGTVVKYKCRDNTVLMEGENVVCHFGVWVGDWPKCVGKCNTSDLHQKYGGLDITKNMVYSHSETLDIHCLEGYRASSPEMSILCQNGEWEVPNNPCNKNCNTNDLQHYDSLDITKNMIYSHSETLDIHCREGYLASSPEMSIICQNGEWKVPNNTCNKSFCYIPEVENGEIGKFQIRSIWGRKSFKEFNKFTRGKRVKHNETLFLRCKEGFLPTENETISENNLLDVKCNEGIWSKDLQCIEAPCKLNKIDYPGLIMPSWEFLLSGDDFEIVCENGFRTSTHRRNVTCSRGELDITESPCMEVVTCDPPNNPDNGYVTASTYEYGSELSYHCDKGFILSTDETVYCTEKGNWSRIDVNCIETVCEIPERPEYGYVSFRGGEDRPRAGSIATFSCAGDRIAYGPTTSKCLEVGVWTFPPPKCLEPCTIQYVSDGEIGRYVRERYSRRRVFKKVELGTGVEDDEYLFLRCSNGFEAAGSGVKETKVTCSKGKWFVEPRCDPIVTCDQPNNPENGYVTASSYEYGSELSYQCDKGFILSTDETVYCTEEGNWSKTDVNCIETVCEIPERPEYGYVSFRGGEDRPRAGSIATFSCAGDRIAYGPTTSKCLEVGVWTFPPPKCLEPCAIQYVSDGEIGRYVRERYSRRRVFKKVELGTGVEDDEYLFLRCSNGFEAAGSGVKETKVTCSNGKWFVEPRCDPIVTCDPPNNPENGFVTASSYEHGSELSYQCDKGFILSTDETVYCTEEGNWSRTDVNCIEPCSMKYVSNGVIGRYVRKGYYKRRVFIEVELGARVEDDEDLYLRCYNGFEVAGSDEKEMKVTCRKGKWSVELHCEPGGEQYFPTTSAPSVKRFTSVPEDRSSTTMATKSISPSTTPRTGIAGTSPIDIEEDISEVTSTPYSLTEPPIEACFCVYPIDDSNLVAHADGQQLKYGDRVREGTTVIFRCLQVGFQRFSGPQEMTCDDCQPWNYNDFPSCTGPESGNTVILLDRNVLVSMDGTIQIPIEKSVNFTCVAFEAAKYPEWNVPTDAGISLTRERREREKFGDILYVNNLQLQNAGYENEGTYECSIENNPKTTIKVIVIDHKLRCPEFPEDDGIIVEYEMERRKGSKVSFTCPKTGQELIGKPELTCLRNTEWSDPPPYCTDSFLCLPPTKPPGSMLIFYPEKDVYKFGERLIFSCPPGMVLSLDLEVIMCLRNGWSHNILPKCRRGQQDSYEVYRD